MQERPAEKPVSTVRCRQTARALVALALATGCLALGAPTATAGSVAVSAVGSGHITRGGENRTFEFSARETGDGTARGMANLHARNVGWHLYVEIDCVRVIGNVAYLSGMVVNSDPAFIEGAQARFAVIDNGEGSGAGDMISLVETYGPGSPVNCETVDDFPGGTFPVERGNVQVRSR